MDKETQDRKRSLSQAKKEKDAYRIETYSGQSCTGFGVMPESKVYANYSYKIGKDFSISVYEGDDEKKLLRIITLEELEGLKGRPYCDLNLSTLKPIKKAKEAVKA